MASTAGYTRHQLRTYAARAWTRWQRRLVIDPEVVRAIRRRCPRLRAVIISSASTEPTVEHAAETLGVDGRVSSAVDVYRVDDDEIFSAPVGIPAWLRRGRPKFFSRPGAVMHNSSSKKVSLLRMNYPEVFARNSVSVAITDNNYGEDRSWPHHFRHVVALNSRHPFSPILPAGSPCETIRIADATPIGMQAPAGRRFGWHGKLAPKSFEAPELSARLGVAAAHELESLRDRLRTARERASSEVDGSLRQRLASVGGELAETVDHYNRAAAREKPAIARSVYGLARELKRVRAELDRAGSECARIRHEMERVHSRAAAALVTRGA
jgi:hypothetical protein